MGAAVSAWWAAWKWIVLLATALALSLYANWWQLDRARRAPLRAENKALNDTLDAVKKIAKARGPDDQALMDELRDIAERARPVRVQYLKAKAERPLDANCAPGQARMDAVNAGADP